MANLGKALYEEVRRLKSQKDYEIEDQTDTLVAKSLAGDDCHSLREDLIDLRAQENALHNLLAVAKSYFQTPGRHSVMLWLQYEGAMNSAINAYEKRWGSLDDAG